VVLVIVCSSGACDGDDGFFHRACNPQCFVLSA